MKQLKHQIIHDIELHKWTLLLPVIFEVVIGLIILYLSLFVDGFNSGFNGDMNIKFPQGGISEMASAGTVGGMFITILLFAPLTWLLSSIILSPIALNENIKNKCELMYRCLPIASWKVVLSKYIVFIVIPIVEFLILSLINLTVIRLNISALEIISFGNMLKLMIVGELLYSFYILVSSSFFIMLSAWIKKNALSKFLIFCFSVYVASGIVSYYIDTAEINILSFLSKVMIDPNLDGNMLINIDHIQNILSQSYTINLGINSVSNYLLSRFFCLDSILLMILSVIMFFVASYGYKYRKMN